MTENPISRPVPDEAPLLLRNANVLDYLPVEMDAAPAPRVELTDLRIAGGRIVERGPGLAPTDGEEVIDVHGQSVIPGHVNTHHHLYSTLAPGMPAPGRTPRNFQDILTEIWWKLDRTLDPETNRMSALAGAWNSARCGTTLVFDHHSSLTSVGESLDDIEYGLDGIGIRGCLCYEVTDRGGPGSRDTTLAETRRYLEKVRDAEEPAGRAPRFKAMAGAHASFTLEDRTLMRLGEICDEFDCGLHIHLCEGTTDREICRERGWDDPLARLDGHGLLRPQTILAHGVDLTPDELKLIERRKSWIAHNGRSNMNNGVGRAPVDLFPPRSTFGTDGLDGNMWGEMRTTFFRGNETGRGPLGFTGVARFWIGCYQLAREVFGEPFGSLDAGAPADFIVLNPGQRTPLSTDNWLSMTLFGFHPWDIFYVYCDGRRVYTRGDLAPYDGEACRAAARKIWDGMTRI